MRSYTTNIKRSETWLQNIVPQNDQEEKLKQLGILFCNRIINPADLQKEEPASPQYVLQHPTTLIRMNREDLFALAQKISLSEEDDFAILQEEKGVWGQTLGGLALSYARSGDLIMVITLIRAAACLKLDHPWLTLAIQYLLSQQHSDGSFGLLESESAFSGIELTQGIKLHITIEALWTISKLS